MIHPLTYVNSVEEIQTRIQSLQADKVAVLVDTNTEQHCFKEIVSALPQGSQVFTVPAGEESKSLSTVEALIEKMSRAGYSRQSLLICLGGGVVTDLGGLVAGLFHRGIRYMHIPTTLLAQVDAAIGGKNGVNVGKIKNIAGLFTQAEDILVWPYLLRTLPQRELISGMAETVKHALIADTGLWAQLQNADLGSPKIAVSTLRRSAAIKMAVVKEDVNEKGLRKVLNFGHTLGHAIEAFMQLNKTPILHGEAVAVGMMAAAVLSREISNFAPAACTEVIAMLKRNYPLPTVSQRDAQAIVALTKRDKKLEAGTVKFVLLSSFGQAGFGYEVSDEQMLSALAEIGMIQAA